MILHGIAEGLRAAGTEPDPIQILDVLWLAALMPPAEEVPTAARPCAAGGTGADSSPETPLRATVPAVPVELVKLRQSARTSSRTSAGAVAVVPRPVPALPNPLGVGRALRPLRIRRPAPEETELDEAATAERFARQGYWLPVLRARRVRWPDLALVVDCMPEIWSGRIRRLELVLQRLGAFRQHRTWRLHPHSDGGGKPVVAPGLTGTDGPERDARSLAEPTGRRLLLVVTDGQSTHWRGPYRDLFTHWTRTNPVAVVSLVAPRLWARDGLKATAGAVRTAFPLQANQHWDKSGRMSSRGPALPIPVADLHPRRLAQLACALGGSQHWSKTLLLDFDSCQPAGEPAASPADAVARARLRLRPRAFDLLVRLSAVPLVLGPLTDRARRMAMPDATDDDFAELLGSGLVEPVRAPERHREVLGFRFSPGIREELGYRLGPSLRNRIWWDLFVFAQDVLGLGREHARRLLDKPNDILSVVRVAELPAVTERRRPTFEDWSSLVAVASTARPRCAARIRELAVWWADSGLLASPQVTVSDAADLTSGGLTVEKALAGTGGGVLVLENTELLRDRANPRCRKVISALVELTRRPADAVVVLSGRSSQITALLGTYPRLGDHTRLEHLPGTRADDAYLILRGLARADGFTWTQETETEMWALMCRIHDASPQGFHPDSVARGVYRELVAGWRGRSGGGEPVIELADLLSVEMGGPQ